MSSNKLSKLIEKYSLRNIIKVILLLLILFLIYRIFIEPNQPVLLVSDVVMKRNIYEGFQQAMLGNGNIYGNILTLNNPTNIPIYLNNTCIFKLSNIYRIDTLVFNFNTSQNVNISFLDGNGNTKYIKSSGLNSSTGSPPTFSILTNGNTDLYKGPIVNITDENDLVVYTSQIMVSLANNNNFLDTMIDSYGIYGGDRDLPFLNDFNTISNSLYYSDTSFDIQQSDKTPNANDISDTFTFVQPDDTMIYALKMDIFSSKKITKPMLTESQFNINITY